MTTKHTTVILPSKEIEDLKEQVIQLTAERDQFQKEAIEAKIKVEKMKLMMEDPIYFKGRLKAINELIEFIENKILSIKKITTTPNTPRQITNGGKLLAYNKILQKLLFKKKNIESYEQRKCYRTTKNRL